MEVSLKFIAERMAYKPTEYILSSVRKNTYNKILLYSDILSSLEEKTLYLCQSRPDNTLAKESGAGFIILNIPESDLDNLDFEFLYLKKAQNFTQVFNQLSSLLFSVQNQFLTLQRLAGKQDNLQKITEQISDILGNPAYIVDSGFRVLAIEHRFQMRELSAVWRHLEDDGYFPPDLVGNLIKSKELDYMEHSCKDVSLIHSKYFYTPFINCNLIYKGHIQGHLFIAGIIKHIKASDIELAIEIQKIVLESMMNDLKFQNNRGYLFECFIKDLLEGKKLDPDYVKDQLKFLNFSPSAYYLVGKVCFLHRTEKDGLRLDLERIAIQLERHMEVKIVRYERSLTLLYSFKNFSAFSTVLKSLKKMLRSF